MFFKYLILISCTLVICNSMHCTFGSVFENLSHLSQEERQQFVSAKQKEFYATLPEEEKEFALAIIEKNNAYAEHILNQNPTIDINKRVALDIPWTIFAILLSDNKYMLKVLIDKGLDTADLGLYFYSYIMNGDFKPNITKIILKYGFLKQLAIERQATALSTLLKLFELNTYNLPQWQRNEFIQLVLNGFDLNDFKQYITVLYEDLANDFKDVGFNSYITHITHLSPNKFFEHTECTSAQLQFAKEFLKSIGAQNLTFYTNVMQMLKYKGLDLKTALYKKLLSIFANKGNTELTKYLILKNDSLPLSDLEDVITNSRKDQADQNALEFMKKMANETLDSTEQQKAVKQDTIQYLQQQWLAHKNKNVVKLLRRLVIIARLFNALVPKEIAYKIAQYDSTDFQDQKFVLLPSRDQVREFIAQRKIEHGIL